MTPFAQAVYAAVQAIPAGETRTYREIAASCGRPKAFRAVGSVLKRNRDLSVPCHRVIRSDGSPGGYNGLRGEKERLLREEKG